MDPNELVAILGRNVRSARTELGLSQQQLAEFAGLSVSHISDIELGRAWVSAESLVRVADVLLRAPWMLLVNPEELSQEEVGEVARTEESLHRFADRVRRGLGDVVADALRATYEEGQAGAANTDDPQS